MGFMGIMDTLSKFISATTLLVGINLISAGINFVMAESTIFNNVLLHQTAIDCPLLADYQPPDNGGPKDSKDGGSHFVLTLLVGSKA